jgi:hypothetical protein
LKFADNSGFQPGVLGLKGGQVHIVHCETLLSFRRWGRK